MRPHHLLRLLFAAENNRVEVVAAAERGVVHRKAAGKGFNKAACV